MLPFVPKEIIITSTSCNIDTDGDGIGDASDNCEGDLVSTTENIGIGENDPKTKLHINGNIFIDKDNGAIIMRSENKCWILKVGDDGVLSTVETDCP
mgnify:CR=1 FL=1